MPRLVYTSTRSTLVASLARSGLPAWVPARATGTAILAELDAVGAHYDALWATYGATLTARETTYASALSTWRASFDPQWSDATDVAKYLEGKLYSARVGTTLTPREILAPSGLRIALTQHTDALPVTWADPTPATSAKRTLLGSGSVPALRITARPEGLAGNCITVQVSNATSTRADECKLTFTRGTATAPYVEVYDNLDFTSDEVVLPDVSESVLVRSIEHVGLLRPINLAPAALSGGAGNVLDTTRTRLTALAELAASGDTALTATDRRVAVDSITALDAVWGTLPVLVNPLEEVEAQLQAAMDRATAVSALIDGTYPA